MSYKHNINKKNLDVTGQIRIISGRWRGRKLPILASTELRPTPNRVRETLFNWLTPSIQHANCLDCFAGSGALGIEALSRYADSVTLLELKKPIAWQLTQNLEALQANNAQVIQSNTIIWLAQHGKPYQVVFIDPPFRKGLLAQTLKLLENNGWLTIGTLIYIESEAEKGAPPVPANWFLHREKVAGQVAYRLYLREGV